MDIITQFQNAIVATFIKSCTLAKDGDGKPVYGISDTNFPFFVTELTDIFSLLSKEVK